MARLELKCVNKIYPGGNHAIDRLSLEVQAGEFVVLVGRSGCGKSTLLRMIAGLEDLTDGELLLDGKSIGELPTKERNISLMTQSNSPNANLSVYDNLAQGLKIRKVAPELIDVRVKETAELFHLTDDLAKKPKMLSAAARRQIALGRIVAREPKVMLFDDPFSNLNQELRFDMCAELVKLHARLKGTFVYATDNLSEALTLGTRVVVMNEGRILQDGTPLELYDRPNSRYVADLIGSPAVNLFDGTTLASENGTVSVRFLKQEVPLSQALVERIPETFFGKTVTLGIRPEDVRRGTEVKARVERIEGEYAVCELNYNSDWLPDREKITARLSGATVGEELSLSFDTEHAMLFDGKTGESIF